MGFRAGPFVLCKDGCCHQRRRNTNFGLEIFFSLKNFPPHMCSQIDQRDVGIILSHVCWGRTPPPPPPARQEGQPQPKPPSRHGDQGGGGGGWANGLPCHPPPAKQFSSRLGLLWSCEQELAQSTEVDAYTGNMLDTTAGHLQLRWLITEWPVVRFMEHLVPFCAVQVPCHMQYRAPESKQTHSELA